MKFDRTADSYRRIRNTIRFLLSNLYDFDHQQEVSLDSRVEIDLWILKEAEKLQMKLLKIIQIMSFIWFIKKF